MKKIITLLSFIPIITFGQPDYDGEIRINIINGSSWNLKFQTQLDDDYTWWDFDYNLIDNGSDYTGGSTIVQSPTTVAYLYFREGEPNNGIGFGRYKISANSNPGGQELAYFHYDTRTTDEYSSPDVTFQYDVNNNKFMHSGQNINGTIQYWYSLIEIDLITTGFEPHKPLNLIVTGINNHPYLEWEHYFYDSECVPFEYLTGYDIYRSTFPNFGYNKIGSVTTDDCDEESYTDYDVFLGDWSTVYYKIKTVNGSKKSEYSNRVSIDIGGYQKKTADKLEDQNLNESFYFKLLPNYPNPFNPTTTIKYIVKKQTHVSLRIFDILGKEVVILVDEIQPRGMYKISFNAENLTSGTYYYVLKTGLFVSSKKMILVK